MGPMFVLVFKADSHVCSRFQRLFSLSPIMTVLTKLAFNYDRGLTICHDTRRQAVKRQAIMHGML